LLFAYVLMPSHLHAILKPEGNRTISNVLQSFGSFTAHAILAHLVTNGHTDLVTFFAQRLDGDTSKRHQIWQPIQPKNIYSADFLREKLEYTHNNPVAKHWQLVGNRCHRSGYTGPHVFTHSGPPVFTQTGPPVFTKGGPLVFT
jgi:hypothetical protein